MYGAAPSAPDSDRTAFRQAEKKYKLYKTAAASKSRRRKPQHPQPADVDLSDVYDFKSVLETFERERKTPAGISPLPSDFHRPVFCLQDRPGFFIIPDALSIEEQAFWVKESLTDFPQPPNRTNHNTDYGPIHNLFNAAQNKKILFENEVYGFDLSFDNSNPPKWEFSEESPCGPKGGSQKSIAATVLLRKLRWSTLGLQFNWSKRNYDVSLPHNKIPDALCQLAKKMAAPAMPMGEEFQPEAAIVNYFASGDMLGGHLDDMEVDWSKPIVSISLGCKAVFLLGGKSREEPPVAMFLRSGDIVLMAGQARECFHG